MRKLIFIFSILSAVIISFVACKKEEPTYMFQGIVWDKTNNAPMANATIKLYIQKTGMEDLKVEIGTGSSGEYNVGIPRGRYEAITLEFIKDGCFVERVTRYLGTLKTDDINIVDVNMTYESTIAVRITNTSSVDQVVQLTSPTGKTGCLTCCSPSQRTFLSTTLDTTYYCPNDANTSYEVFYIIGTIGNGLRTATAAPGDTAVIHIQY